MCDPEDNVPPRLNRQRAWVKPEDLFAPTKSENTLVNAGDGTTAIDKAKAMIKRLGRKADAYTIATKTFQTNNRDIVTQLPRPSLRFNEFVAICQQLIDDENN
jgi:hypothetical protein